jgi:hypothetical protein
MKFTSLIPALLVATAYADTPDDQSDSPQAKSIPIEEPTPVGQLWTAKWDTTALQPYTQHCLNRNTYEAKIYKLADLYPDLEDFAANLKMFYSKQLYAGSWDGVVRSHLSISPNPAKGREEKRTDFLMLTTRQDTHGVQRDLIQMSLPNLPYKVRSYIKSNPKQRHYSVQEDSVFFAPGAIYPILPLWVDEPEEGGSQCDDVFDDLDSYSSELGDGKVVGKVTHSKGEGKDLTFTVEAMLVKKKGKAPTRKEKEEL